MIGLVATVVVMAASTVLSPGAGAAQRSDAAPTLDWRRGTYEGVRLADRTARVRRLLGAPRKRGGDQPFTPIGEDFYAIGGLTDFRVPALGDGRDEMWRYRRRVFLTAGTGSPRGERPTRARRRPRVSASATPRPWSSAATRTPGASSRTRAPSTRPTRCARSGCAPAGGWASEATRSGASGSRPRRSARSHAAARPEGYARGTRVPPGPGDRAREGNAGHADGPSVFLLFSRAPVLGGRRERRCHDRQPSRAPSRPPGRRHLQPGRARS